jgi:uncharacterized protein YciI
MWYLVLSRPLGSEASRQAHYDAHRAWLEEQHRAGRILLSGPSPDHTGIYLMQASSLDEAKQLAAADPHYIHGDRAMEVTEWDIRRAGHPSSAGLAGLEALLSPSEGRVSQ